VAVFLVLLSVFLYYKGRRWISAFTAGLAVASKFSVAPLVAGLWLVQLARDRRVRDALVYLLIAFSTYLSTYLVDLKLGWDAVLRHHVEMISYMSWRHGFSLAIAVLGFLKLLFRVELWRYSGDYMFIVSTSNGTLELLNTTFTPVNKWYLVFYTGGGSPLWHLLFPSLLYATYLVLAGRAGNKLGEIVVLAWLSLLNVVAGPLDWYFINTLPFLYTTLVLLVYHSVPSRYRWVLMGLALIHIVSFVFTVLGVIPFKTVLTS